VKRSPGSTSSSGRPRPDFFRAANDFCDRLVFLKTGESLPMKKCAITALVFCATSLTLLAASIDGKWTSETKFGERTIQNTFNLKSDGGALTGTMEMSAGGQSRSTDIKDGKIDGDKFKFTTVQRGKQGERTIVYEGTVDGDELKGTMKVEGMDQSRPFN